MSIDEKLDLILERLDKNEKLLREILKLTEEDTPVREFLLNLSADMVGNILTGGK